MARIRPYESQVSPNGGIPSRDARPSDVAPNYAPLGQAIESGGYAAGHAQALLQDQASRAAVTDVHVMLQGMQSEYTRRLAKLETEADPKDNNINEQFFYGKGDTNEPEEGSFKWYADSYKEQIQDPAARQAFDLGMARLSTQFSDQIVNVQARMAGVYAKQQATKMIDAAQVTVQTDPSLYSAVVAQTTDAINDPRSDFGRLSAEQREPIKRMVTEQISKSAIQGLINLAPEQALRQLTNNTHGMALRGEDLEPLIRSAETSIRAKEVEARRVEAEAARQKTELHHATDQNLMAKYALHEANPGNPKFPPLKATDIGKALNEDRLDGGVGRAMLNMIEERARRGPAAVHTNPNTERNLFKGIHNNTIIDTKPIYDAYTGVGYRGVPQLDDPAMERLRKELTDSRSPEGSLFGKEKAAFLKGIEPQITKPGPFGIYADPTTPEKFATFQRELDATIDRYQRDGKDPRTLFDENSKDYFGKVAKSSKYQSSGFGSIVPPAPTPAPPGTAPRKSLDEIFGVKP
jgi:hypothetical protein